MAHVAFLVEDGWQNKGVGSLLLRHITAAARSNGIAGFVARVRPQNSGMLQLFHHTGCKVHSRFRDGQYEITIPFNEPA
jgi:GNAT superfamily N-acetyltransferase